MTTSGASKMMLSLSLIVTVGLVPSAALASESTARLSGSIVNAADGAPLAGAKLHAGDSKTGEIHTSAPADETGDFVLDELPPATYRLAVEAHEGLYVVETPLPLAPGVAQTVNLAVTPMQIDRKKDSGEEGEASSKMRFWNNPLTAALAGLGVAAVVGFAVWGGSDDSSGKSSSPSNPGE